MVLKCKHRSVSHRDVVLGNKGKLSSDVLWQASYLSPRLGGWCQLAESTSWARPLIESNHERLATILLLNKESHLTIKGSSQRVIYIGQSHVCGDVCVCPWGLIVWSTLHFFFPLCYQNSGHMCNSQAICSTHLVSVASGLLSWIH